MGLQYIVVGFLPFAHRVWQSAPALAVGILFVVFPSRPFLSTELHTRCHRHRNKNLSRHQETKRCTNGSTLFPTFPPGYVTLVASYTCGLGEGKMCAFKCLWLACGPGVEMSVDRSYGAATGQSPSALVWCPSQTSTSGETVQPPDKRRRTPHQGEDLRYG